MSEEPAELKEPEPEPEEPEPELEPEEPEPEPEVEEGLEGATPKLKSGAKGVKVGAKRRAAVAIEIEHVNKAARLRSKAARIKAAKKKKKKKKKGATGGLCAIAERSEEAEARPAPPPGKLEFGPSWEAEGEGVSPEGSNSSFGSVSTSASSFGRESTGGFDPEVSQPRL